VQETASQAISHVCYFTPKLSFLETEVKTESDNNWKSSQHNKWYKMTSKDMTKRKRERNIPKTKEQNKTKR
jgi:hypothetical protein